MRIGALSAYPDQLWFDPDRPAWLPYWLDDLTESNAKYNAQNLMQATANAAGALTGSVVSAGASGVAEATTTALGGMNFQTIAVLAAVGFVIYALKK